MSAYRSDPTANAAIGSVDRELRQMRAYAQELRRLRNQGKLTPEQLAKAKRQFTGIFRPLLEKALG